MVRYHQFADKLDVGVAAVKIKMALLCLLQNLGGTCPNAPRFLRLCCKLIAIVNYWTGTKILCGEGGCGSCVVSVSKEDPVTYPESIQSVNSVSREFYLYQQKNKTIMSKKYESNLGQKYFGFGNCWNFSLYEVQRLVGPQVQVEEKNVPLELVNLKWSCFLLVPLSVVVIGWSPCYHSRRTWWVSTFVGISIDWFIVWF